MNSLKPQSDVINEEPKVLIIGYGWVGRFIGSYFKNADHVGSDGIVRDAGGNMTENKNYDLGFVCVPTPMQESGRCDTSIVEGAIRKWKDRVKAFCIKSTVEIGTTDKLVSQYEVPICFSPEYLGETVGHPLVEPKRETFIILGGEKKTTKLFAEAWSLVTNSYTKIYQVDARMAELCKLMENSWIATKVMFVNEFFDLAERLDLDFYELREIWLADPRISRSHTYVYRKNRGFSGKCLPKDLNNLVWSFKKLIGFEPRLIKFLLEYNADLRNGYTNTVKLLGKDLENEAKVNKNT